METSTSVMSVLNKFQILKYLEFSLCGYWAFELEASHLLGKHGTT
jgi:hypothetical protein